MDSGDPGEIVQSGLNKKTRDDTINRITGTPGTTDNSFFRALTLCASRETEEEMAQGASRKRTLMMLHPLTTDAKKPSEPQPAKARPFKISGQFTVWLKDDGQLHVTQSKAGCTTQYSRETLGSLPQQERLIVEEMEKQLKKEREGQLN